MKWTPLVSRSWLGSSLAYDFEQIVWRPHMQRAQTHADLVALTRPDDVRPVRQADQRDGQQISVRCGL